MGKIKSDRSFTKNSYLLAFSDNFSRYRKEQTLKVHRLHRKNSLDTEMESNVSIECESIEYLVNWSGGSLHLFKDIEEKDAKLYLRVNSKVFSSIVKERKRNAPSLLSIRSLP